MVRHYSVAGIITKDFRVPESFIPSNDDVVAGLDFGVVWVKITWWADDPGWSRVGVFPGQAPRILGEQ